MSDDPKDPTDDRPTKPPPYRTSQRLMAMVRDRSALAEEKQNLRDAMTKALRGAIDALVAIAVNAADASLIRLTNTYYHIGKSQGVADASAVFAAYRAVEHAKCDAAQRRADPRREPVDAPVFAHELRAQLKSEIVFSDGELEALCKELGLPLQTTP